MASSLSAVAKPQFGPWLLEQVESGRYKGLCMMGNDKFRIPWKHNARRDLNDEDVKIFKEWAIVSGKIMEHPDDKAKWKTNFRCALRSLKTFEMVEDHSKDPEDQHKIYRIIFSQNSQEIHIVQDQPPFISEVYKPVYCTSNNMEQELLDQVELMDLNEHSESQPLESFSQPTNQSTTCNYFETHYSDVHTNTPALVQQPYITVFKTRLQSPLVHFFYQCDPSDLRGEPIRFPNTEDGLMIDHKQIQYTKRILESIQRGLQLEVNETGIYGFRQDLCKVFFSTTEASEIQNAEPRKLSQNIKEQLLSFDKYLKDLRDFKENKRGSPDYTIYLCFGEKLHDGKPLTKKLITVKVLPLNL
ncbi:hypothetical protein DNTS_023888 [Danionella cerebrum]|uniref:IRF tryptophan pentad repeat domain-containing protein n=1 Tax=Danionella cerebrum TaxID=2873325 RepID=A0A553MUU8_9TELE|nr:hypothetical protein DNTS_023888 [Danionella translucida]